MTRPLPKTRRPVLKKKRKSWTLTASVGSFLPPKTTMPRRPATMKSGASSRWRAIVIVQAATTNVQARRSLPIVFLPSDQQAFTISATTAGAMPWKSARGHQAGAQGRVGGGAGRDAKEDGGG